LHHGGGIHLIEQQRNDGNGELTFDWSTVLSVNYPVTSITLTLSISRGTAYSILLLKLTFIRKSLDNFFIPYLSEY